MLLLREEKQRANEYPPDFSDTMHEEPVELVLTAMGSGINLARVEFQPDLKSDEFLFSGFLTALRCVSDVMSPLSFDQMKFGKYTMLMREEPPFLFCYIFRGPTSFAINRLDKFIQTIRANEFLLDSLKNTISTGVVDRIATASINDAATQVFEQSGQTLWRR